MSILLVSSDLMFSSQATQAAAAIGRQVRVTNDEATIRDLLANGSFEIIVVDLTQSGLDLEHLNQQLSDAPDLQRIAVGPHVHKATLDRARQAGWQTYTRGSFHADAPHILGGAN